jgi:hypothetical protein
MTTIGEAIAPDLRALGGVLRCETCKNIKALGDIGAKLNSGWPKCCGYTMRWWTQRQIDNHEMPPNRRCITCGHASPHTCRRGECCTGCGCDAPTYERSTE